MTELEAIKARHSVRKYTEQPIEKSKLNLLREEIQKCNAEAGIHIQLVVDEPKAFSTGEFKYGAFSGVRNYLVMAGKKDAMQRHWPSRCCHGESQLPSDSKHTAYLQSPRPRQRRRRWEAVLTRQPSAARSKTDCPLPKEPQRESGDRRRFLPACRRLYTQSTCTRR